MLDKKHQQKIKKRQKWSNETIFRFYKKNQVHCLVKFGLRNPKLVSDLNSDLIMMTSQQRPNVQLPVNPVVTKAAQR